MYPMLSHQMLSIYFQHHTLTLAISPRILPQNSWCRRVAHCQATVWELNFDLHDNCGYSTSRTRGQHRGCRWGSQKDNFIIFSGLIFLPFRHAGGHHDSKSAVLASQIGDPKAWPSIITLPTNGVLAITCQGQMAKLFHFLGHLHLKKQKHKPFHGASPRHLRTPSATLDTASPHVVWSIWSGRSWPWPRPTWAVASYILAADAGTSPRNPIIIYI